jgi:hypothetical protein
MSCLVFDGVSQCSWCLQDMEAHPYRWCRRCRGDGSTPDPLDRESQLAGRPAWGWKQLPCACRGGIVTMGGQPLSQDDRNRLESARRG